MANVHTKVEGDKLVITIDISKAVLAAPSISNSEAKKAEKEGRAPKATQIATSGGFLSCGPVKVSLNAMLG